MGIPVNDRLFLEFKLARIIATAFNAHGAIMVTVDLADYNVINGGGYLAPLKTFPIIKLECKHPYWIELNGPTPKFTLQV